MLVLLGPSFAGGDDAYQRLAKVTAMGAYDLRSRLKPGIWGMVKVLADVDEAERLTSALQAEGFPAVMLPREVASDPARPIVALKGLEIERHELRLHLRERDMTVPFAALSSIVRGEAQVGKVSARATSSSGGSSSTFRAVVPNTTELQVFRESTPPGSFEAFAALDLHFHSVTWIARIGARGFDFRALSIGAASPASALDTLADRLALLAQVRVDRAARASSVASFVQQARSVSTPPSPGQAQRGREIAGDERFDPYSRIIGEAERLLAQVLAEAAAAAPV
jgi:hypothetical protein